MSIKNGSYLWNKANLGLAMGLALSCKPSMNSPKIPDVTNNDSLPAECTTKSKDPACADDPVGDTSPSPKSPSSPAPQTPMGTASPRKACVVYKEVGLPKILNCSAVEDQVTVVKLVQRAKDGLGFPSLEGPREEDTIFVGNFYMAWVDNTGYSGKMNALWSLNNQIKNFDFTMTEPTPKGERPVSMLLPGEDGDGKWARAYNGAEHYELPRFQNGEHTAQAGIREANHFTDAPETWKQCINADKDPNRWNRPVGTMTEEVKDDGTVILRNEAPLTIVMRSNDKSFACGMPFPLESGEAADIRLASGYIFYPKSAKIERLYQMRNYSSKDLKTEGIKKLIGGQLLTDWPHPHYLKQYQKLVKWDSKEAVPLTALPYNGQGQTSDAIDVHSSGSMVLSVNTNPVAGRMIAMQQMVTPNAGEDFGTCLCHVHGGFEFTGSVLAGQDIKAMKDGKPGIGPEQMRTILLDGSRETQAASPLRSITLEMEKLSSDIHQIGAKSIDGVSIATDSKWGTGGFLLYKDYQTLAGPLVGQVTFNMKIDIVKAADDDIAEIDIMWKGSKVIAKKMLKRSDFFVDNQFQRFVLDFELADKSEIEPRVRWLNHAAMTIDSVVINTVDP